MKKLNCKFRQISGRNLLTGFIMAVCISIFSCEDQNYLHDKYLKEGETIYLGVVDSVVSHPGDHRIKFEWLLSSDTRSTKTVIYWNERDTSVTVPLAQASGDSERWAEVLIDKLDENDYIFEFEMQDDNGNISKSIEVAGSVLGNLYVENIRTRTITEVSKLITKEVKIVWATVNSSELQYSVVEYTLTNGEKVSQRVENNETETLIPGLETGSVIQVYSVYLPENGIDTFNTKKEEYTVPKFEHEINKSKFVAAFTPGDNTTPHPGSSDQDYLLPITDFSVGTRSLAKIWDGGTANNTGGKTILHTTDQSSLGASAGFKFPHKFSFDIGVLSTLSRIHVWPRTDATAFTGHSPRFFEVWATDVPKKLADFGSKTDFETYYRTTYVVQKNPADYLSATNTSYVDLLTQANTNSANFVTPEPAPGIHNWQEDWVKLGDFEVGKPSQLSYGNKNNADVSAWAAGFDFPLQDTGKKYRYVRIIVKFPTWQNANCINLGEVTLYGDDL
ncbi:MAG: DUF4998 domain-containing protein [Mangrovibacterium sp.]